MTQKQKIADAFSKYEIIQHFENYKSVFLITTDQIIIINNNYIEKSWGELDGLFKHVYLEITNITSIFKKLVIDSLTHEIVIVFNQYVLHIPLLSENDCTEFIECVETQKNIINEN